MNAPKQHEFSAKLRECLTSQDNRATSHPLFIVQERRRIWGVLVDYTETFAWVDGDGDEVEPDMAEVLEAGRKAGVKAPSGYQRVGYVDLWEFSTACLTEAGAEAFIRANGHNLRDPRIYVASAYRNQEWIDLRAYFMAGCGA